MILTVTTSARHPAENPSTRTHNPPALACGFKMGPDKPGRYQVQQLLKVQPRKNPHRLGRVTWPVVARAGVRTGFFCGWRNKSFAAGTSGRAVRRGLLEGSDADVQPSMQELTGGRDRNGGIEA